MSNFILVYPNKIRTTSDSEFVRSLLVASDVNVYQIIRGKRNSQAVKLSPVTLGPIKKQQISVQSLQVGGKAIG